jgi:Tfp pilus assembly protein PilF
MRMRNLAFLVACLVLAACASAPRVLPPGALLADAAFAPPGERISADDVFALSDEMRRYIRAELAGPMRAKGRQKGLIDALYGRGQLQLSYDASMTRNAAQAFAARSGNCLSLVIMTAAFAKELDLRVEYRSAFADETWSRSSSLYFRSGHVNVTLGRRFMHARSAQDAADVTVDFLPGDALSGLRTAVIDEPTVIAMYMNNRAAEALAAGRIDDAYWWAREAVAQAPAFVSAYITLGVVYQRRGLPQLADGVLAHVLERAPSNAQALANRAPVLEQLGRGDEAQALRRRLVQIEPNPPFHFYDRGREAMRRGDFGAARDWFAREVRRVDHNPEFHYWLGVATFKLGDVEAARKHLSRALEHSTTGRDRDLYAAKLEWLLTHRRQ